MVEPGLLEAIGPWTEVKLDILRKYALPYSRILSNQQRPALYHVYIDAFTGAGRYLSKESGELVPGSPEIALAINPPFREYQFIDIDQLKISRLEQIAGNRDDVHIHHGDSNDILLHQVLPRVRYEDYRRGLCLLDPYGMHLKWTTVQRIGEMKSVEVVINFPIMDINRNVLHRDPLTINPTQAHRMTEFWGDDSWKAFYQPKSQLDLWGQSQDAKAVDNEYVANAYRRRLMEVAGFRYVPQPLPMRNSFNAILYYLFFASYNDVGRRIIEQIFDKYRRGE